MEVQIVKINFFHKIVLAESGPGMPLELSDVGIKPDGLTKIESIADFLQCAKHFVGAGVFCITANSMIFQKPVFFE